MQLQDPEKEPYVRIGNQVGEGVSITIVTLKGFEEDANGVIDIQRIQTEGRMTQKEESEAYVLEVTSTAGKKSTILPPEGGFANGTFYAREEALIWQKT